MPIALLFADIDKHNLIFFHDICIVHISGAKAM